LKVVITNLPENHFEELEAGKYRMGQDPATLQVVEPQVEEKVTDLLPSAAEVGYVEKESYPDLGFGIGLSTYSPDFSGLSSAFTAIEDKYRKQGYTIQHHDSNFDVSPLLWNIKIRFSYAFALLLETGKSLRNDVEFKAVSASLLYHFQPFEKAWFRPYVGAGISSYHFSVERKYGPPDRISPVDSIGSYRYLDVITSEGGNIGLMVMGGIELATLGEFGLSIYGNYSLIPAIETTTTGSEKATVKFSGFVAGVRITIYF
jgi:hypothetical protein